MRLVSAMRLLVVAVMVVFGTAPSFANFADKIAGLEKKSGLLDVYLDHKSGKVFLSLEQDSKGSLGRYIYAGYLTAGLGSNPMGLDRSVPSGSNLLHFRRAGNQVMAVIENTRFRASADNFAEKEAVKTSFAESIIWSTNVEAEDGDKVLIDLTDFLVRDTVGVAARLASGKQGNFKMDAKRSYADTKAAFAFPLNLEFDAHITFAGSKPGAEIRATTPNPEAVTLVAHTTFMQLPDDKYSIRMSDERAGVIDIAHIDMSAPLAGDTVVRYARRFRLQKGADGKVINPVIFYIDNGAPEPIRSALVEGGNWWADAFAAAGYPGGYRVEVLPEGVHPLDARYNVVNWVHRATRGWSYGAAIHDPRTGEVLRGVVLLGSLRVRQDIKIFEALAGAGKTGTGVVDDPVELALARIRQLSAHEIGHALGFSHNMAASSYGDRASVMDYPAPDVRLNADSTMDFSRVYGVGAGAWDYWTVNFLYGDYEGEQKAYQAKLIAEADAAGLLYVSDRDSRNMGTGHLKGGLWDNGSDLVAELKNIMAVRAVGLANFGVKNLRKGESFSALQTKFVPLYLYHRYQVQAAVKSIGGFDFVYRAEGDSRPAAIAVPWTEQQTALTVALSTITPGALDIKDSALSALTPLADNFGDPQFDRESFDQPGRPMFSHAVAAAAASDVTLNALLHPMRLQRLVEQGVRVEEHIGLTGVLDQIVDHIIQAPRGETARHQMLRSVIAERLTERLIALQENPALGLVVKSGVRSALVGVRAGASKWRGGLKGVGETLAARITTAFARANTPAVKAPKGHDIPPGSPIGGASTENIYETCWHCEMPN